MSTRYNNGSHYENHRRAAELHESAAHAHRSAAEQHGKQDHLAGQELSRQALEHSRTAFERSAEIHKAGMAADSYQTAEELRSSNAPVHPPAED